jgi:hypothetical protein
MPQECRLGDCRKNTAISYQGAFTGCKKTRFWAALRFQRCDNRPRMSKGFGWFQLFQPNPFSLATSIGSLTPEASLCLFDG